VWAVAFGGLGGLVYWLEGGGESVSYPLIGAYFGTVTGISYGVLAFWARRQILTRLLGGLTAGALSGGIFALVDWLTEMVSNKHVWNPLSTDWLMGIATFVVVGAVAGAASSMFTKRFAKEAVITSGSPPGPTRERM